MGDRAADRAAMAHLRVADVRSRVRERRAGRLQQRVARELRMARQRADRDPVALAPHVAQLLEPVDVDEQRRPREAQPQHRDQRVAAGEHLRVLGCRAARPPPRRSRRGRTRTRPGSRAAPGGRELDRLDDVVVPGAAAEVALEPDADLLLRRVRILGEQRDARHHEPGRAVAALEAVQLVERLLHRMQLAAPGEALDGRHLAPVGLHGEHGAGLDGLAVEQHGARAARRGVAADVRSLQAELVAQEVREQLARLDVGLAAVAVDDDRYLSHEFT